MMNGRFFGSCDSKGSKRVSRWVLDLKRGSLEVIRGIAIASEGPQHRSEDRVVSLSDHGYEGKAGLCIRVMLVDGSAGIHSARLSLVFL